MGNEEEQTAMKPEYVGIWRITEMSEWDQEYIDLVAPGHLTVKRDGTGEFQFGVVETDFDCRVARVGETERLEFSFAGSDERDEVFGRGWATVNGNQMAGWFSFHLGDESTFRAERKGRKRA